MGKVTVEQSISLDGFSTGPDVTNAEPMGVGGEALHEWMYRDVGPRPSGRNEEAEALLRTSGAVIVGRRMFDLGVDPWGDPPPFHMPVFVITHRPRDPLPRTGGTTYYFVTGGLEDALAQARKSAGDKTCPCSAERTSFASSSEPDSSTRCASTLPTASRRRNAAVRWPRSGKFRRS